MKRYVIHFHKPAPYKVQHTMAARAAFHYLVAHAQKAQADVMELLKSENLLAAVDNYHLQPNECKMFVQCTEQAMARIRTLPCIDRVVDVPYKPVDRRRAIPGGPKIS